MAVHGGLLEAYLGYYEEESLEPWTRAEPGYVSMGPDAAQRKWCEAKIAADTPEQRLEIYMHWNGMIGWSGTCYEIATGGGAS